MEGLSIIISHHNEKQEFTEECVRQINETIDVSCFEIIVVDDYSDVPLSPIENVKIIRHKAHLGVGAAFDTGMKEASYDNIVIMANDIRFLKNQWASQIYDEIQNHPKALTCTGSVILSDDVMDMEGQLMRNQVYNGATMTFFSDGKMNSILDAKWLGGRKSLDVNSYEVPCILGAFYGVKKQWYQYIDGWTGHDKHGSLEPFISLKSWMFGGSTRVAPRIKTGHIYKKVFPHKFSGHCILKNKIIIATMLLDDPVPLLSFYAQSYPVVNNKNYMKIERQWAQFKRNEYKPKIIMSAEEYAKHHDIPFRLIVKYQTH